MDNARACKCLAAWASGSSQKISRFTKSAALAAEPALPGFQLQDVASASKSYKICSSRFIKRCTYHDICTSRFTKHCPSQFTTHCASRGLCTSKFTKRCASHKIYTSNLHIAQPAHFPTRALPKTSLRFAKLSCNSSPKFNKQATCPKFTIPCATQ